MEKHKPGEANTSNNSAVFVLPPELLAKLGIDLKTIKNSKSADTILVEGSDQNSDHENPNSLPERDASSIIETANLMKESVFLSPTFLQNASNLTLEEEATFFNNETVPTNHTIPLKIDTNNTYTENTLMWDQSAPVVLNGDAKVNEVKSNHVISLKQLDSLDSHKSVEEYHFENQDGNLILTDVSYRNTRDVNISNDKSKTSYQFDEHLDEAYLSDSSNSFSGCSPERSNTEVDKQRPINKIKDKVGEVVIDDLQFKKVQNVCFPNQNIPTIIVNSIATGKELSNDSNIDVKDNESEKIVPKLFQIEEPVINSGNLDIEIQTLDNVVYWTPVDQTEKEIGSAKIEFYDSHNNSIIQINETIDAKKSSDETIIVLVNPECTQSSQSIESVSECSIMKFNGSEKCSKENDKDLPIAQRNIKYNVKNKQKHQNGDKDTPEYKEKKDLKKIQMKNCSKEVAVNKVEENMVLNTENNTQDKVKEIAAYLSKIANERKKIFRNHETNKEKRILSKSKLDPMKRKLCIDGVEKPSGNLNGKDKVTTLSSSLCSKVLKTYQRTAPRKQRPALIRISDDVLTSNPFQLTDNYDNEKQDIKVGNLSERNKFCICFDFGNLAYYDCEMLYEHIHFWQHKNITCDSEIIYSIYNEDYTVSKEIVDFIEDGHQNAHHDNATSEHSICWNDITTNKNNVKKELTTRDSSISEKASSSSVQKVVRQTSLSTSEMLVDKSDKDDDNIAKRVRNRKRSSVTMDQAGEGNDSLVKNQIKCGVCNQLMSDTVWKAHKETEHNSIAWKADQDIDIKDKNLMKSLGRKLEITGFLKCPICKSGFKQLVKFTKHIKKCKDKQQKETSCATTSDPTISTRSTRRSLRNSTSSKIDLLASSTLKVSNSAISHSQETDISVTKKSTKNEMDKTPRSSSKKEVTSKFTVESLGVESDRMPKNKCDSLKSSKNSTITTSNTANNDPVRSIRSSSKRDMPLKLTEKPEDEAKDAISRSIKHKSKFANIESAISTETSLTKDTAASASVASSRKSINVDVDFNVFSRSTRNSVSSKVDDATKSQKMPTKDTFSPKSKRMSSKTELTKTTESTEVITNTDRVTLKLAANTEIIKESLRPSRRLSKINDNNIGLSTKSTDTHKTDVVNKPINTYSRITRKASILETESTLKPTNHNAESNSTNENIKIGESSKTKSSNTAVESSSLSTETAKDIESGLHSESKPKRRGMQSDEKSSTKITKYIESDIQTVSPSIHTNTITDEQAKLATQTFLDKNTCKKSDTDCIITTTNKTEKSPKTFSKQTMIKDLSNLSTIDLCDDILPETDKSRKASIKSRDSTNKTHRESSKTLKRSSYTVNVDTPVKKLKTMDTNSDSMPANSSAKISNNETHKPSKAGLVTETKTNRKEQTKLSANSSNIEFNESVLKKHSTNDVDENAAVNKSREVDVLPKSKRKNSNTKITNPCKPVDTEDDLPLKSAKPRTLSKSAKEDKDTSCLDRAIIDVTMSEDLSTNSSINEPETSLNSSTVKIEMEVPVQIPDNSTKCGVCKKIVENVRWIKHISEEHDYLAWRDSEPALNLEDPNEVKQHLQVIAKQNNGLVCSKCGMVRKIAKPYLRHIKSCNGEKNGANISKVSVDLESENEQEDNDNAPLSAMKDKPSRGKRKPAALPPITCGVCSETVEQLSWIEHIRVEHDYLAWRDDETPLNLDDEDKVKQHLNYISKFHGGLLCCKCGFRWNYVKKYLMHKKICGTETNDTVVSGTSKATHTEFETRPVVTCGVCKLEVEGKNWITHIQRTHEYMAWVDGDTPLDIEDPVKVKEHLVKVVAAAGELVCMKCGLSRKHARAYMLHMGACNISGFHMEPAQPAPEDKDKYECGVCHVIGKRTEWKEHAISMHYNIAWMVGELPINLRNPYAVEKYLKEYQKKFTLMCKNCKATRASCYGFYAHIMTCGKTEEELEAVHNVCDICNNKYLCIYRNQHVTMHREQEYKKELKASRAANEAASLLVPKQEDDQPMGKRKAAQKAKKVIEKYAIKAKDGTICTCGAIFENAEDKSQHKCDQQQRVKDDDDSDLSVKMESISDDESIDSDIDSNVSDEEEEQMRKKKRLRIGEGSTKITRMPYRVDNYMAYLIQAFKDFCGLHYTSKNLFDDWRNSEFEVVPTDEMHKYLPTLTESCKVRFSDADSEWTTYQRFESKKIKGYSLFTGGSVQCMQWAPHNLADETLGNYLAVATHRGADAPRYGKDERPAHPGLLQIWDFQQFNFLPRCALSVAHTYGAVWALAWCPSGARDRPPGARAAARLGLLAAACSDGAAYIFAVPCPPAAETENEHVMYKLKPVAELRLAMTSERPLYQATTINWSQQKGHNIIIVGYSDGTTALYDLNTESTFLKDTENDVTIFYPFQDKQSENSPITGVAICPTANEAYAIGGFCSTSPTGSTMRAWPAAAPSVRSHLAAGAAHYCPQWPAAALSGDALLTVKTVNELEWWGGGRRLGAARGAATCARCGRGLAAAAPAVRLLRAHVCYPEIKKQIVATLIMVPLGQKRKRKMNDDLSIVVEPLTYEDAVTKYGLQLGIVIKNDQVAAQKLCSENELFPERFPLSEIVAASFVPSARFHEKITLATHSGMIFVINV